MTTLTQTQFDMWGGAPLIKTFSAPEADSSAYAFDAQAELKQAFKAKQDVTLLDYLIDLGKCIGMRPMLRKGETVVSDDGFPVFTLTQKCFTGRIRIGKLRSDEGPVDDESQKRTSSLIKLAVSAHAGTVSKYFESLHNEPRFIAGVRLLNRRINMMRPNEDPFQILLAFKSFFSQMNFVDNRRNDFTLRNAKKTVNAEKRRRDAGKKARKFRTEEEKAQFEQSSVKLIHELLSGSACHEPEPSRVPFTGNLASVHRELEMEQIRRAEQNRQAYA